MGGIPSLGIHEGHGILGHLLDGQGGPDGLAAGDTAIVKRKALKVSGKGIGLRLPARAVNADTLDEKDGRAAAADVVGEGTAGVLQARGSFGKRHGSIPASKTFLS